MTNILREPQSEGEPASTEELLERRARIREWIDGLDAAGDADPALIERVRLDYEGRLQGVLLELGEHVDGLKSELTALEEDLAEAEATVRQTRDELAEAELRHRVGELGGDAWKARESVLRDGVERTEQRRDDLVARAERLAALIGEIERAVEDAPDNILPPEPDDEETEPFLETLDRAIIEAPSDEPDLDPELTRPKPGTRCGECGYTNAADAWYCGVCGADLA